MDENLGRQHEDEVLQAFDRLGGEFLAAAEEAEEPVFSVLPTRCRRLRSL